jgi:hypothetical protein
MISFKQMVFATSLITLTLPACGQELNDGDYEGEPRHVLEGSIEGLAASDKEGETYVSVVWLDFVTEGDSFTSQTAAVSDTKFPAEFTLALYDAPPKDSLNEFELPDGKIAIGTGYIMVFQDGDGDGQLTLSEESDAPDTMLGMAPGHVMLYVPVVDQNVIDTLSFEGSFIINPEALQPGFNLARGVCAESEDEVFDKLEIVPVEDVGVIALDDPALDDACIDFT